MVLTRLFSCSLLDLVSQDVSLLYSILSCSSTVQTCLCAAAFIEFEDGRDADDAVRRLDGKF